MSGYCQCKSTDQWYGVADVVTVPVTPDMEPWVHRARAYAGLVLCGTCTLVAPWRGEPVGQFSLTAVAYGLQLHSRFTGTADAADSARLAAEAEKDGTGSEVVD